MTDGTDKTDNARRPELRKKCKEGKSVISRQDLSFAVSVQSVMSVKSDKSSRKNHNKKQENLKNENLTEKAVLH